MIKWNGAVFDRADEDLMVWINREQDDEFCRKLRAALRAGKETCPVGVSTEPGTKRPIFLNSGMWRYKKRLLDVSSPTKTSFESSAASPPKPAIACTS